MNYKITSPLIIADPIALAELVFPSKNWTRLESSQDYILLTFDSEQIPVSVSNLIKIEKVTS